MQTLGTAPAGVSELFVAKNRAGGLHCGPFSNDLTLQGPPTSSLPPGGLNSVILITVSG